MYFNLPRVWVLFVLVLVSLIGNAQTREPQVAGRVIRSGNGMPIEGAKVELEQAWSVSSNGQYPTAITDKDGEYHFAEIVKADAYRIRASAEGFVGQTYSRDGTFKLLKNPAGVVLRSITCRGAVVTPDTPLRIGDREKVQDCEAFLGTDTSTTESDVR